MKCTARAAEYGAFSPVLIACDAVLSSRGTAAEMMTYLPRVTASSSYDINFLLSMTYTVPSRQDERKYHYLVPTAATFLF